MYVLPLITELFDDAWTFQVDVQDRHHMVSLRRPAVRPQVWLMDLLWLAGWGLSFNSNRPRKRWIFELSYFAKSFCISHWTNCTKNLVFHWLMNVCSMLKSWVHWHGFDSYFRLWIIHTACKDQPDGKKTFAKWNTLKPKPTLLDCPVSTYLPSPTIDPEIKILQVCKEKCLWMLNT